MIYNCKLFVLEIATWGYNCRLRVILSYLKPKNYVYACVCVCMCAVVCLSLSFCLSVCLCVADKGVNDWIKHQSTNQ